MFAMRISVLLLAIFGVAVSEAAIWYANSGTGLDHSGCGTTQSNPCLTIGYTIPQLAAGDTLQLVYGTSNTGAVIPFVLTKIVFIQTNSITINGDNPPPPDPVTTPPTTLVQCGPGVNVGIYVSALGSTLSHFQLSGCTQTGVTYDFESFSHGHSVVGCYFNDNYKGIGAEGCELLVARSWFVNGISGAITSGSASLTLRGNTFKNNSQSTDLGPLGSCVMAAKTNLVMTDNWFEANTPVVSARHPTQPVVWISYGSLTSIDNLYLNNAGGGSTLYGMSLIEPVVVTGDMYSGQQSNSLGGAIELHGVAPPAATPTPTLLSHNTFENNFLTANVPSIPPAAFGGGARAQIVVEGMVSGVEWLNNSFWDNGCDMSAPNIVSCSLLAISGSATSVEIDPVSDNWLVGNNVMTSFVAFINATVIKQQHQPNMIGSSLTLNNFNLSPFVNSTTNTALVSCVDAETINYGYQDTLLIEQGTAPVPDPSMILCSTGCVLNLNNGGNGGEALCTGGGERE